MLLRFIYLDTSTLADYAAQLDGGTLVETKTRRLKRRSGGAKAGVAGVGLNLNLSNDDDDALTYTHPPAAQFQRLLAVAEGNPDALLWTEVLEPDSTFKDLQVGETLMWECDADIHQASRMMAKGADASKVLEMLPGLLSALTARATTDNQAISPEDAQKLEQLTALGAVGKQLIDDAGLMPVVVCTDDTTEWSLYGELDPDYLRADIKDERLMIVGKVKRIVPAGTWRRLITAPGIPLTTLTNQGQVSGNGEPPEEKFDPFVRGPALQLDILAIYR